MEIHINQHLDYKQRLRYVETTRIVYKQPLRYVRQPVFFTAMIFAISFLI